MKKEEELSYKKVNIQDLQDRPHLQGSQKNKKQLSQSLNDRYSWIDESRKPILCYHDSGLGPSRIIESNGLVRSSQFFHAFQKAYINHGDIVLIPDEIWIMISLFVSKYIDKNAEKLRHKLVTFEGKKTLEVVELASSAKQSLLMEHKWDTFFDQIIQKIKKETKAGVAETLQCNFSTTNKTYELISTAIIMNSFKSFFKYTRSLAGCGINNAYMAGIREDWVKLGEKLNKLADLDVDGKLKEYIKYMSIILDNFLLTFDGKPDVKWWNTIMTTPEKRQQYGGDKILVQGWILYFFGIYKEGDASQLPDLAVKVPIKLVNNFTKVTKHLILISDWVSISKMDQRTYKPDIGMSIVVNKVENNNNVSGKQKKVMQKLQKIYLQPSHGLKKHTSVRKPPVQAKNKREKTLVKKKKKILQQ